MISKFTVMFYLFMRWKFINVNSSSIDCHYSAVTRSSRNVSFDISKTVLQHVDYCLLIHWLYVVQRYTSSSVSYVSYVSL